MRRESHRVQRDTEEIGLTVKKEERKSEPAVKNIVLIVFELLLYSSFQANILDV